MLTQEDYLSALPPKALARVCRYLDELDVSRLGQLNGEWAKRAPPDWRCLHVSLQLARLGEGKAARLLQLAPRLHHVSVCVARTRPGVVAALLAAKAKVGTSRSRMASTVPCASKSYLWGPRLKRRISVKVCALQKRIAYANRIPIHILCAQRYVVACRDRQSKAKHRFTQDGKYSLVTKAKDVSPSTEVLANHVTR